MINARDQRAAARGARQQQPAQALVNEVNDEGGEVDDLVQNQVPVGQGAAVMQVLQMFRQQRRQLLSYRWTQVCGLVWLMLSLLNCRI